MLKILGVYLDSSQVVFVKVFRPRSITTAGKALTESDFGTVLPYLSVSIVVDVGSTIAIFLGIGNAVLSVADFGLPYAEFCSHVITPYFL